MNKTHGMCVVPLSKYIQSVRFKIVTTDSDIMVSTNHDHFYEYISDFELY